MNWGVCGIIYFWVQCFGDYICDVVINDILEYVINYLVFGLEVQQFVLSFDYYLLLLYVLGVCKFVDKVVFKFQYCEYGLLDMIIIVFS